MHQYARGEAVEVSDPIGLVGQDTGKSQGPIADFDVVADLQAERSKQACLGPGFTRPRPAADLLWLERCGGAA